MRKQIDDGQIEKANKELNEHLYKVLSRKGRGTFSSSHEALGILEDERSELVKAIQEKQDNTFIKHELLDLAVTALFAVACINSETMEW